LYKYVNISSHLRRYQPFTSVSVVNSVTSIFTMASQFFTIIAGALFALFSMALGQTNLLQTNFTTNWNPTGEGCVDTVGFLSCYTDQGTTANSCADACSASNKKGSAPYNTCVTACDQLWYAGNIGCWLQSCWNQVSLFMPYSFGV
jgi:hypothetical protein